MNQNEHPTAVAIENLQLQTWKMQYTNSQKQGNFITHLQGTRDVQNLKRFIVKMMNVDFHTHIFLFVNMVSSKYCVFL